MMEYRDVNIKKYFNELVLRDFFTLAKLLASVELAAIIRALVSIGRAWLRITQVSLFTVC